MRSIMAITALAFACGGCAFPAPPTDAGAYPTPTYVDDSEPAQGWWEPFGPDAHFVAVNWLDDLRHPRAKHESYGTRQYRQAAPALRYGDAGSVRRQQPADNGRGVTVGKNFGGPQ